MTTTAWLSAAEQRAWRNWLAVHTQLPAALQRELQQDSGLSWQDFEVLVQLSEAEEPRARVSDLAQSLQWERSRLSHHIKRMEARELVRREECADDGRGAFVVLTDKGRSAIEGAAPAHAAMVKQLVFDVLSESEVQVFETITARILSRVNEL